MSYKTQPCDTCKHAKPTTEYGNETWGCDKWHWTDLTDLQEPDSKIGHECKDFSLQTNTKKQLMNYGKFML